MPAFRFCLCLALLPAPVWAESPFLDWKGLAPGPHAVGFRALAMTDATRSYGHPTDALGRARPNHARRALQVTLWYPARPTKPTRLMTYGDYVALTEWELGPERTTLAGRAEALRAFILRGTPRVTAEQRATFDRLFRAPVGAFRNAPTAPGRFPAVVLGPGGGGPGTDNSVLAEYLASHGYVVISCPSVGSESRRPVWEAHGVGDAEAMDTCTRDLEFLVGVLQDLPMVDPKHIGTAGFSWGGITNVLLAMKDSRIKAVISLDDAMDRRDLAAARRFPQFQPERLRVPFLMMVSEATAQDPGSDPSLYEQAVHANTWKAVVPDLRHEDFCALYGLLGRRLDTGRNWGKLQAGYEAVCRLCLRFLDAHLKGEAAARQDLPKQSIPLTYRAAIPVRPRPAQFLELLERPDASAALALFREIRKEHPSYLPCREMEIRLAAQRLLDQGRTKEAVAAFTLAVEAYPTEPGPLERLAEALEATGENTQAREALQRALQRLGALPEAERTAAKARLERRLAGLASGH